MLIGMALLILACAPVATPPPFRAPALVPASPTASLVTLSTLPPQPTPPPAMPSATPNAAASATPPCTNGLRFMQDLNYPDDTTVRPGETIAKEWLVENDGTCNWDQRYQLQLAGGLALGAASPRALYPARGGTQATLRIVFIAPDLPGGYRSEWRALGPGGETFGDPLYIQIVVTP